MVSESELRELIAKAEVAGARVVVERDEITMAEEGRDLIERFRVEGVAGFGPGWMAPIYGAERLREFLHAKSAA